MATKKETMQKDLAELFDQVKERLRKFGKELSVFAKKSEKEIIKASKAGKIQVDIMGLGMQKEKLYYDIGKRVASLRAKKSLDVPELEPYWKKMRKVEKEARQKKRELLLIKKKNR